VPAKLTDPLDEAADFSSIPERLGYLDDDPLKVLDAICSQLRLGRAAPPQAPR
jgi:hypothetical protein